MYTGTRFTSGIRVIYLEGAGFIERTLIVDFVYNAMDISLKRRCHFDPIYSQTITVVS